jgi:hypothetical protein
MFRFALLQFVLFLPFITSQTDGVNTCIALLNATYDCYAKNDNVTEAPNTDTSACTTCFANNNFFNVYDVTKASCSNAKSEICEFLGKCRNDCFPTVSVCQDEYDAYVECAFGIVYAPDGCLVQCDGTTSAGTGSSSSAGTGSSSSPSMSLQGSFIVVVTVAMVGNGMWSDFVFS